MQPTTPLPPPKRQPDIKCRPTSTGTLERERSKDGQIETRYPPRPPASSGRDTDTA